MAKFYFAGSIRGGRDDAKLYFEIVNYLQTYGTVLTEHVASLGMDASGEAEKDSKFIHDRDMEWLKECDFFVAEVTQPSLGVGYEVGRALDMKKPILCLFRPESGRTLSAMIGGAHNGDTFQVHNYCGQEYKESIDKFYKSFKKD